MHQQKSVFLLSLILGASAFLGPDRAVAEGSSEPAYQLIEKDLEPFKSDFNAASDHVRAVLLVGPT